MMTAKIQSVLKHLPLPSLVINIVAQRVVPSLTTAMAASGGSVAATTSRHSQYIRTELEFMTICFQGMIDKGQFVVSLLIKPWQSARGCFLISSAVVVRIYIIQEIKGII